MALSAGGTGNARLRVWEWQRAVFPAAAVGDVFQHVDEALPDASLPA